MFSILSEGTTSNREPTMSKGQTVLFAIGYVVAIVMMGLGAIFLMASPIYAGELYGLTEMIIGIVLLAVGVIIIVGLRLRQRIVVEQKITLKPTQMRELKCKNCSATLSEKDWTIKNDVVNVKCTFCGALYEMTDQPTW
jgi:hypothetical protein